jgi:polyphenol oxidase
MHWALPDGVHALCTTRAGGLSVPPFDSLNLGTHVHDDAQAVAANRGRLAQALGGAHPVFLNQVHGVDVAELSAATPDNTPADACLTTRPQVACAIMVADCLPLLLTDVDGRVVAAAHAGWRGLAAGVVERTVQAMCQAASVSPSTLRVWLGPCIGPDVFEVGGEVREAFMAHGALAAEFFKPHPAHAGKWLANLAGLARARLQALGVADVSGNDGSADWCTVTQASTLFSFRRDGVTGRFAACIWRAA